MTWALFSKQWGDSGSNHMRREHLMSMDDTSRSVDERVRRYLVVFLPSQTWPSPSTNNQYSSPSWKCGSTPHPACWFVKSFRMFSSAQSG